MSYQDNIPIEEKFYKAVNVIRNLPHNGSYQPSTNLQLRFYAYYKQATEGPNRTSQPNFWEIVKRAKWTAWNDLGEMPKSEAMFHYVEELRKIVETMSYSENVSNFLDSLDNVYENVPPEDLEILVGPVIDKIRSRPNSPLSGSTIDPKDTPSSRDSSPLSRHPRASKVGGKHITGSLETSPASSYSASPQPPQSDDDEEEYFVDTETEPDRGKENSAKKMRPEEFPIDRNVKTMQTERPHHHSGNTGPRNVVLENMTPSEMELVQRRFSQLTNTDVQIQDAPISGVPRSDKTKTHLIPIKVQMKPIDTTQMHSGPRNVVLDKMTPSETEFAQRRISELTNTDVQIGDIPISPVPCSDNIKVHILPLKRQMKPNDTSQSSEIVTSEAFRRAVTSLTREMEQLQHRMAALETLRTEEVRNQIQVSGFVLPAWWNLSPLPTAVLLLWPFLVVVLTRWLNRRH